jgi:HEAT repeat protein
MLDQEEFRFFLIGVGRNPYTDLHSTATAAGAFVGFFGMFFGSWPIYRRWLRSKAAASNASPPPTPKSSRRLLKWTLLLGLSAVLLRGCYATPFGRQLGIALIGETRMPAGGPLLGAFQDNHQSGRDSAARSLAKVDTRSQGELVEMLKSQDVDERRAAAKALAEIGPPAASAAPELAKMLLDPAPSVREDVADACAHLGPELANATVREVAVHLDDQDGSIRIRAAVALGQMGKIAGPATPALVKRLLTDSSYGVRWEAADSLGAIGDKSDEVTSALAQATHDKDYHVREAAEKALAILTPRTATAPARARADGAPKTESAAAPQRGVVDILRGSESDRRREGEDAIRLVVMSVIFILVCIALGQFRFRLHPSTRILIFLGLALAAAGGYAWQRDMQKSLDQALNHPPAETEYKHATISSIDN